MELVRRGLEKARSLPWASEGAERVSEGAGRASDRAGQVSEGAGRPSEGAGMSSKEAGRTLGEGNRETIKKTNGYFLVVVPQVIVPFGSAAQQYKIMIR